MHTLMEILKQENLSCIIEQHGTIYKETGKGITPILALLENGKLHHACVADKVIGKAAAMIMVYGGVRKVDTILISVPALQFFQQHNVIITYETMVPHILNRENNGMCPMEACVLDITDMRVAHQALIEQLARMKMMSTS